MTEPSERVARKPEWLADLRPGDVLETPSGSQRLVRAVSRQERRHRGQSHRHGMRVYVTFAIRRPSWTRRPYTVLTSNDTYLLSMKRVARLTRLRLTGIDQRILMEIHDSPRRYGVTPEMVRGLP